MRAMRVVGLAGALIVGLVAVETARVYGAGHDPSEVAGHMKMTELRPVQPGDAERAKAIATAARKFADQYVDYRKALADGYAIFHPEIKQDVYHFTNNALALQTTIRFDASKPTSLLYDKTADGYKLVGVMYTAPFRTPEDELNQRVPLSIAQWHLHTNLCLPPAGVKAVLDSPGTQFGLQGSIKTYAACQAAGGSFLPHLFGWMVHVYPYEKDPAKIWAAGMDDDHGMQHDTMPAGMPM